MILFLLLFGCSISKYPEGVLIKTKVYCGKFVNIDYQDKTSIIQTTMLVFTVKGFPDVPKGSYCYIRRELCRHDVTKSIKRKMEPKYFSWNNSKEYRVKGSIPHRLFN